MDRLTDEPEHFRTIQLDDGQITLLILTLKEKRDELDVVLKNPDGLEQETIHECELRRRDINDIMRELQFYAITSQK